MRTCPRFGARRHVASERRPQGQVRSQIALFGGLETPKVFASGRPLLAHLDPSTAREVDRPLRRAMLNKSRLRRHYFSIEPRTLSGLDPPSRATQIGSCIFPGQKIQKTVLHLFSSLDPGTTAFHSTLLKPLTASRLMRKSFVRFGLPFFVFCVLNANALALIPTSGKWVAQSLKRKMGIELGMVRIS